MQRKQRNISKKTLKILEPRSDGRGGSKLTQKTYIQESPRKNPRRLRSESPTKGSPSKSKKQKMDDFQNIGSQEPEFFLEDPDSDPRQTKVSCFSAGTTFLQQLSIDPAGLP